MNPLEERSIHCPHCGESFMVLIDCLSANQPYIEDCMVCCCPIEITVFLDELHGEPSMDLLIVPAQ